MATIVDDFSQPIENTSFWQYRNVEHGYEFERIDILYWISFMKRHWAAPLYTSALYIVIIFGLEKYMRNRPAFHLKIPFVLWNAVLGLFSVVGFLRTASAMMTYLGQQNGLYKSMCERDYMEVALGFWGMAFGVSKFVELGDTIFIVLRKRPLQLLQWYHHMITLIYCWLIIPSIEPVSRWFIVVNYGVHSFMYPYFALTMAGIKLPRRVANFITSLQLLQMIFGFLANVFTITLKGLGYSCYRSSSSMTLSLVAYGTFIILFGQLFVNLVLKPKSKQQTE